MEPYQLLAPTFTAYKASRFAYVRFKRWRMRARRKKAAEKAAKAAAHAAKLTEAQAAHAAKVAEARAAQIQKELRGRNPTDVARAQLRLVHSLVGSYWEELGKKFPYPEHHITHLLAILEKASKALTNAQRYDADATIDIGDAKGITDTWTTESFAAQLLFLEATSWKMEANRRKEQTILDVQALFDHWSDNFMAAGRDSPRFTKENLRQQDQARANGKAKELEAAQNGIRAMERALEYTPTNTAMLNVLTELYVMAEYPAGNIEALIQKTLSLDPDNTDTLKLALDHGVT